MKVKYLVLIGIVVLVLIVGATIIITKNIDSSQGNEELYDSEEEVNVVEVNVRNGTGKAIETLYSFQENNEDYVSEGNDIWVDTLDGESLGVDEEATIYLETTSDDDLWDFMIATEDGETYELMEVLSTDYIYDGVVLEFVIVDDYLDVYDQTETSDEDADMEEQESEDEDDEVDVVSEESQEENSEEEQEESVEQESEEIQEENQEESNEEDNDDEIYLEDFSIGEDS